MPPETKKHSPHWPPIEKDTCDTAERTSLLWFLNRKALIFINLYPSLERLFCLWRKVHRTERHQETAMGHRTQRQNGEMNARHLGVWSPGLLIPNIHESHFTLQVKWLWASLSHGSRCEGRVDHWEGHRLAMDMHFSKNVLRMLCSSISGPDPCNVHITVSWHLQLYKHAFDVHVQNTEALFCPCLVTLAWMPFAMCIASSWGTL